MTDVVFIGGVADGLSLSFLPSDVVPPPQYHMVRTAGSEQATRDDPTSPAETTFEKDTYILVPFNPGGFFAYVQKDLTVEQVFDILLKSYARRKT